jgi:hypothetical protein
MSLNENTTAINDLKLAQNRTNEVTIFKNHEKKWQHITPYNSKGVYHAGDLLEFNLKGQGIDYINMNGSSLLVNIEFATGGAQLPFGTVGLINRFQFRSGAFDFQDIINYNRFVFYTLMGSSKVGFTDSLTKTSLDSNTVGNLTNGNVSWLKIPLITALDAGGYVPVYNLAEDLRLRITLEDTGVVSSGGGIYEISDAYLFVDGLTATSGANLDDSPYKFHTTNVIGFKDALSNSAVIKISYDVKKTSLKGFLGQVCFGNNDTAYKIRNSYINLCSQYKFTMGGINYPFQNYISVPVEAYIEFEKYFHRQDSSIVNTAFSVNYTNYSDTNETHVDIGLLTGCFDKIDQSMDIVSGLDTERFPITVEITNNLGTVFTTLFGWFTFDVIITIIGGEIKIED